MQPTGSEDQPAQPSRRKLVFVGDGACGKTHLILTYIHNKFVSLYIPTVFDNYVCDIKVDNLTIPFDIHDTAGPEDYDRLRPLAYPNTDVFVVCFSAASRWSYENVSYKWIPEVRHYCPQTPIILASLMTDLRNNPSGNRPPSWKPVSAAEGAMLSRSIGAYQYVECSAKTGEGVNDVFVTVAKAVLNPEGRPSKSFRCVLS